MHRLFAFLCALILLWTSSHAVAQSSQPCAGFVGKWHNEYDILVDLTILDTACNFSFHARAKDGLVRMAFGAPKHVGGTGYISDGSLALLFFAGNPKGGHFLLKRENESLRGIVVVVPRTIFGDTFPITLKSVTRFPTDNATR